MYSYDKSQERCDCGLTAISPAEYTRRITEWDKYYQDEKGTLAHQLSQQMRIAVKTGDKEMIAEIQAEVMRRCKWVENAYGDPVLEPIKLELPLPKYPDPRHPKAKILIKGSLKYHLDK